MFEVLVHLCFALEGHAATGTPDAQKNERKNANGVISGTVQCKSGSKREPALKESARTSHLNVQVFIFCPQLLAKRVHILQLLVGFGQLPLELVGRLLRGCALT